MKSCSLMHGEHVDSMSCTGSNQLCRNDVASCTVAGEHKGRKVGSAFVFAKPGHATQQLMDAWAEKVAGGSSDESAALNELLLQPRFHGNLTIGMFPSAAFPTGAESTDDQNSHHQQLQVRALPCMQPNKPHRKELQHSGSDVPSDISCSCSQSGSSGSIEVTGN